MAVFLGYLADINLSLTREWTSRNIVRGSKHVLELHQVLNAWE
jgi:hypothetical protein